jgi:predicted RNase H-like HicB family nuclease
MYYRVGMPFWRSLAKAGLPLSVRVRVHHDTEAGCYWADSPDLDGLVVEGATLDALTAEVESAASMLLELQLDGAHAQARADIRLRAPLPA